MARKATVFITRKTDDSVELEAQLEDGAQFPREFAGHAQANVAALNYGPVEIPSQVKEHPKFMDIRQLRAVLEDWGKSKAVSDAVESLVRTEQDRAVRRRFLTQLNGRPGKVIYKTPTDTYTVTRGSLRAHFEETALVIPSPPGTRQVHFRIDRAGGDLSAVANEVRLTLLSDPANDRVIVQAELRDAEVGTGPSPTQWSVYTVNDVAIPMPPDLEKIESRPPDYYLTSRS